MREHHSSKEVYTNPRPDPGADELTASSDRLSIPGLFLENRFEVRRFKLTMIIILFDRNVKHIFLHDRKNILIFLFLWCTIIHGKEGLT